MKIFSVLLVCFLASFAQAQETAYKAMNAVGAVKGQPYLDNLLNVEGLRGATQPHSWLMTFEDPGSRAGVREIEVRGGQIVGQRAPLKSNAESTARVNLDRLQLDSDGAFTVAEQAAARQKIRFDKANYLLQAEPGTNDPIWRVQLLDVSENVVLTVRVAASNGRLVASTGESVSSSDSGPAVRPISEEPASEDDTTELKIHRTLTHTGKKIGNGFKHIGGSLQQVFTGKRTIDSDVPDE